MDLLGTWKGTKQLYFKPDEAPFNSASSLLITPVANGAFFQLTYTWKYKEHDHEGVILLCTTGANNTSTASWGDSFHQSGCLMHLTGHIDDQQGIDILGSYAASPGPDWGWRITIQTETKELKLTMYNIWPEGQEDLAVRFQFTRVKKG